MLRILIPVLFLLLGLGAGVGAGMFLFAPDPATAVAADDNGHSSEDEHSDEGGGGDDHAGDDHGSDESSGSTEFVRLNNQFVVPIVHQGSVRSLIVMALTVEVENGNNSLVFQQEPRLRDAFLRVMFAHANAGGFDGNFTEAVAMRPLRDALGEAARIVLGDILHDVLIVDITRQDA